MLYTCYFTKFFCVFCLIFSLAVDAQIVKRNDFGTLTKEGSTLAFYYAYGGSEQNLRIYERSDNSIEIKFHDDSFWKINAANNTVTRYSSLTGITETLRIEQIASQPWSVNSSVFAALQIYKNFNESPEQNVPGTCIINGQPAFCMNELNSSYSQSNIASNSCSYEKHQFDYQAWNGYQTHSQCIETAQYATMGAAIATAISCTVLLETGPVACGLAVSSYANAIKAQSESSFQCHRSYEQARRELAQCEATAANTPSSDVEQGASLPNASPTPGNNSLFRPIITPRYCYKPTYFTVTAYGQRVPSVQYSWDEC